MSKLSKNLKKYELDTTVSIMEDKANFSGYIKISPSDAVWLARKIMSDLLEDNTEPLMLYVAGELKESEVDGE